MSDEKNNSKEEMMKKFVEFEKNFKMMEKQYNEMKESLKEKKKKKKRIFVRPSPSSSRRFFYSAPLSFSNGYFGYDPYENLFEEEEDFMMSPFESMFGQRRMRNPFLEDQYRSLSPLVDGFGRFPFAFNEVRLPKYFEEKEKRLKKVEEDKKEEVNKENKEKKGEAVDVPYQHSSSFFYSKVGDRVHEVKKVNDSQKGYTEIEEKRIKDRGYRVEKSRGFGDEKEEVKRSFRNMEEKELGSFNKDWLDLVENKKEMKQIEEKKEEEEKKKED